MTFKTHVDNACLLLFRLFELLPNLREPTQKERLLMELRSWSSTTRWQHMIDLLDPHIIEEVYVPVGTPGVSLEDYKKVQQLETEVNALLFTTNGFGDCATNLRKLLAEAARMLTGARQQYEQLLFDGDPHLGLLPEDDETLGDTDTPADLRKIN